MLLFGRIRSGPFFALLVKDRDRIARILYVASDQTIPGTTGGSIHVAAVAEGLTRLGHDVHVVVTPGGEFPLRTGAVDCAAAASEKKRTAVGQRARAPRASPGSIRPDVVIERYYNFGGEGIAAANDVGATRGSRSQCPGRRLSRLGQTSPGSRPHCRADAPMARTDLPRSSDLIVTPSAAILPPDTPRLKILEIEWGADIDRFRPGAPGAVPFRPPSGHRRRVCRRVSQLARHHSRGHRAPRAAGARPSRYWGGVHRRRSRIAPRPRCGRRSRWRDLHRRTAHDRIPACLAACDIGVAPFDPDSHPSLSLGFYWSPLKIFEYMAAGLPVVAPAIDRIPTLVGHNSEGLLVRYRDTDRAAARLRGAHRRAAAQPARPCRARARGAGLQLGLTLRQARRGNQSPASGRAGASFRNRVR